MSKHLVLRLVAVIAASTALLVLTPGPASATITTFTIVGGAIRIEDSNGTNDIDMPLDAEGPCDPSTTDVSTVAIPKKVWKIIWQAIKVAFWLIADWLIDLVTSPINGADQDGDYDDPSTGDVGPISAGYQIDISEDTNEDCVPDDDPVCSFYFEADLDGSYTGTAPSAVTAFDLDLTTTLPLTPISETCQAPFSTYIDGTVSGSFVGEV